VPSTGVRLAIRLALRLARGLLFQGAMNLLTATLIAAIGVSQEPSHPAVGLSPEAVPGARLLADEPIPDQNPYRLAGSLGGAVWGASIAGATIAGFSKSGFDARAAGALAASTVVGAMSGYLLGDMARHGSPAARHVLYVIDGVPAAVAIAAGMVAVVLVEMGLAFGVLASGPGSF